MKFEQKDFIPTTKADIYAYKNVRPEHLDIPEKPRELILKLGKHITDRIVGKITPSDPEYYGLDIFVSDEMAELALKMKVHKYYTIEELVKRSGKSRKKVQKLLDEFAEFPKNVLEALRQPMEDGFIAITRTAAKAEYPADFMLVAAMNPCPCGNFGSRTKQCRCNKFQIERYRSRVSGPVLDRIDIHVEMNDVPFEELSSKQIGECSAVIRERVSKAREIQKERYLNEGILLNSQLNSKLIKKYCKLEPAAEKLVEMSFERLNLSARAYNRVLKVARTISDLASEEEISSTAIAEALQYRAIDSKYWGD